MIKCHLGPQLHECVDYNYPARRYYFQVSTLTDFTVATWLFVAILHLISNDTDIICLHQNGNHNQVIVKQVSKGFTHRHKLSITARLNHQYYRHS